MKSNIKKDLSKLLKHYGEQPQMLQAVEEMAELSVELIKNINRKKPNRDAIANELADVMNMLVQVQIQYKITNDELQDRMSKKIARQFERWNNE